MNKNIIIPTSVGILLIIITIVRARRHQGRKEMLPYIRDDLVDTEAQQTPSRLRRHQQLVHHASLQSITTFSWEMRRWGTDITITDGTRKLHQTPGLRTHQPIIQHHDLSRQQTQHRRAWGRESPHFTGELVGQIERDMHISSWGMYLVHHGRDIHAIERAPDLIYMRAILINQYAHHTLGDTTNTSHTIQEHIRALQTNPYLSRERLPPWRTTYQRTYRSNSPYLSSTGTIQIDTKWWRPRITIQGQLETIERTSLTRKTILARPPATHTAHLYTKHTRPTRASSQRIPIQQIRQRIITTENTDTEGLKQEHNDAQEQ